MSPLFWLNDNILKLLQEERLFLIMEIIYGNIIILFITTDFMEVEDTKYKNLQLV